MLLLTAFAQALAPSLLSRSAPVVAVSRPDVAVNSCPAVKSKAPVSPA